MQEESSLKAPLLTEAFHSEGDEEAATERRVSPDINKPIPEEKEDDEHEGVRSNKRNCTRKSHEEDINLHKLHSNVIESKKELKISTRRRAKSEDDSDEDEEALKAVVSSKGHFTSFLQVRNQSKNALFILSVLTY